MQARFSYSDGTAMRLRLLRFILSGAGTALLYLVLSYTLAHVGLQPLLGNVAAYAAAFMVGYLLQRNWTFDGTSRHRRALPRYFGAQVACALVSGLAGQGLVSLLGASLLLMAGATTVIAGGMSYILSFYWVFSDDK